MAESESRRARKERAGRRRRAVAALAIGSALALLLAEVALRLLLFHPSEFARARGGGLRVASYYADGDWEDDYWKLRVLFADQGQLKEVPRADAELGWVGSMVEPGTFAHKDEPGIAGRRPVLLYGDSFAQCNTPPGQCFQAVLESTELARDHALLNYGVGGYGLDQICLMLERSLGRWVERDPIVIVSLLVESDLDRSLLRLRDWPKPRFEHAAANAAEPWEPSRVEEHDLKRYVRANPPVIRSYLWRYLCHKPGILPHRVRRELREWRAPSERKWAVNGYLLARIDELLRGAGVDYFFCLFHAEEAFDAESPRDEEDFVVSSLTALGAPWISTRATLEAALTRVDASRLYGREGRLRGHHTPLGNRVAFDVLRAGIEGRLLPGEELEHAPTVERSLQHRGIERAELDTILGVRAEIVTRTDEVCSRIEPARPPRSPRRWQLRAGEHGPTEVGFWLAASTTRFTGRLHPASAGELRIDVDGQRRFTYAGGPTQAPPRIDLELEGARYMSVVVTGRETSEIGEWWEIQVPAFAGPER